MNTRRLEKLTAICWLAITMAVMALAADLVAADKAADAKKYTEDLKTSTDPKVRAAALKELGELGQIKKSLVTDALPDMIKALEDKDAKVRAAAAKSYGMVDPDPKQAVPALLKLAKKDKDEAVKIAAIQGLGMMGKNARPAGKDLREMVKDGKDEKSRVYRAARNALRSINQK